MNFWFRCLGAHSSELVKVALIEVRIGGAPYRCHESIQSQASLGYCLCGRAVGWMRADRPRRQVRDQSERRLGQFPRPGAHDTTYTLAGRLLVRRKQIPRCRHFAASMPRTFIALLGGCRQGAQGETRRPDRGTDGAKGQSSQDGTAGSRHCCDGATCASPSPCEPLACTGRRVGARSERPARYPVSKTDFDFLVMQ
jgi:hypothetical protein